MRTVFTVLICALSLVLLGPFLVYAQEGVGVSIVSERSEIEHLFIESEGQNSSASFNTLVSKGNPSFVCCIPYPAWVRVYSLKDGTREMVIGVKISKESGDRHQTYTITLKADGGVSLTVENPQ